MGELQNKNSINLIAHGNQKHELRLVTKKEDEHYKQLKRRLYKGNGEASEEDMVKKGDINNIVTHMFQNRTRYRKVIDYVDIGKDVFISLFGPMKFFCAAICFTSPTKKAM